MRFTVPFGSVGYSQPEENRPPTLISDGGLGFPLEDVHVYLWVMLSSMRDLILWPSSYSFQHTRLQNLWVRF